MADEDDRSAHPAQELLQQLEAVKVEVVRRLVEKVGVEPGEQQARQPHARRLATGQPLHGVVEREPGCHLGDGGRDARVEVRAPEGQPVLQRGGVVRIGPGRALLQPAGGTSHPVVGFLHARELGQVLPDRAGVAALLGQVSDPRTRPGSM